MKNFDGVLFLRLVGASPQVAGVYVGMIYQISLFWNRIYIWNQMSAVNIGGSIISGILSL